MAQEEMPQKPVPTEPVPTEPVPTEHEADVEKEVRPWLHRIIEAIVEKSFRWIFFWERDDKRLGTLIRFLHHSIAYSLLLLYIFIHTLYPSFILLVFFMFAMTLIWLQHMFAGGCVVNRIERRLLGDTRSFFDPILNLLNMENTDRNTVGITAYTSTLIVGMTALEIVYRCIQWITSFFSR